MKRSTMVILLALAVILIAAGLVIEAVPGMSQGAYETLFSDSDGAVTAIRADLRDTAMRVYVNHNSDTLGVDGSGRAASLVVTDAEGGTLRLSETEPSGIAKLFGTREEDYVVVWLPRDYAGTLTLSLENGELGLSGLDLPGAGVSLTAENGEVSVYDCRLGALDVKTGSGGAWIGDTDVSGSDVTITAGSGRVSVSDAEMDALTMYLGSGGAWTDSLRTGSVKILAGSGEVSLGSGEVGELLLETGSGGIYIDRMRTETMTLTSGSGDIYVSSGEAGAVAATTGSGDIALDRLNTDRADLFTRSGDIRGTLTGLNGEPAVEASTDSGDVSLEW